MHNDIDSILFTEAELAARVRELGAQITSDYEDRIHAGERLVAVCLLRGATLFMADLVRTIELPMEFDFMIVSSYGNEAASSGVIDIQKDLSTDIEGMNVLIIEDVIDSGLTLSHLCEMLQLRNPASLEVAALLCKKVPSQKKVDCKYIGFECPDEFIVGYGLDYAQRYRNLPYIGTLKREAYEA